MKLVRSVHSASGLYRPLKHYVALRGGELVAMTEVQSLRTGAVLRFSTASLRTARWYEMRLPEGCV